MTTDPLRVLFVNPEKFDYLHAALIEGMAAAPDLHLATWSIGNYGERGSPCYDGDVERVLGHLGAFDVLMVGTTGRAGLIPDDASRLIVSSAERHPRQVRSLVDSGDLASLSRDRRISKRNVDVLFKRELFLRSNSPVNLLRVVAGPGGRFSVENVLRGHDRVPFPAFEQNGRRSPAVVESLRRRVRPLPREVEVHQLPIGFEHRVIQEPCPSPDIPVSCTLTGNIAARRQLLAHLRENHQKDVTTRVVSDEGSDSAPDLVALGALSPDRSSDARHNLAYYDFLRRSRASISFPGGGFDTARFWEILAAGSLLISKRVALELRANLVPGEHYLAFDTLDELDEAIRFVYEEPRRADEIRRRGHEYALEHYAPKAQAAYVRRCLINHPKLRHRDSALATRIDDS